MEAKKILIFPLTLFWYLYNFLFDRLGKQRMTPIIWSGNSELIAEVMGGGLPTMFQDLSRSGHRTMSTLLLVRPLWYRFVVMPWWGRRCPRIFLENNPRSHVYCMQYPCMPCSIIILIVFSSFYQTFKPCMLWFRKRHYWGKVSLGLFCYQA